MKRFWRWDSWDQQEANRWVNYVRAYVMIVAATVASVVVVFNWFTSLRGFYINEDWLVENLSAAFYLVAFLLAITLAWRSRHRRWTIFGVGVIGLVGFLDEISFGERWYDVPMPRFFGVRLDAFHDVFSFAYRVLPQVRFHPLFFLGLLTVAAVMILVGRRLAPTVREWLVGIHRHPAFTIFILAVLQIAAALVIDLHILRMRGVFMLEEVFEMNAAIALVLCAWSLREPSTPSGIRGGL